jgi:hypothetical protein
MSATATAWAWKTPTKSPTMKLILIVLAEFATEKNKTGVSMECFQNQTGMTQANVEYALQNLVDDGRIQDTGKRIGDQQEIRVFQLLINTPLTKMKRRSKQTSLAFTEAEEILKLYPRPVDKPTSLAHISKAIKKYGFEFVKERTSSFAKTWQGRTDINTWCPMSSTWFSPRRERFADDPKTWGGAGTKPVSAGPTFTEVKKYIAEKGIVDDRGWASSFYNGWQAKGWLQNGKIIEWQIALSKALARWRGQTQPAAPSA